MKPRKKRQYKRFQKKMTRARRDKAWRNIFVKKGILPEKPFEYFERLEHEASMILRKQLFEEGGREYERQTAR